MAGPRFVIDGPLPSPPPFRLVDVATIVPEESPHWMNGAEVRGYPGGEPQGHDGCSTGSGRVKTPGDAPALPSFGAFTAYLESSCTSRSIITQDDFKARVAAVFGAVESFAVEREFVQAEWTGDNPHLTDTNLAKVAAGAAVSPTNGLALLEDAIGRTAKAGVIHATPAIVTAWDALGHLTEQSGGKLFTGRGTPVVVGDGYIGAHPDGSGAPSACQGWAFATGPVQIRRENLYVNPPTLAEALERALNDVTFYAERAYLVTWDTDLQAGALIDRSVTGC